MKRKVSRLRLSPNEEAQLIREEHERRRKLRIQQVREQERYIALQIRTEVQQRRERELQNLAEELKEEWEQQQSEKLETLQKLYQDNLRVLGEGHRSAKENEPDWKAIAQKNEENHVRADERYRVALKELKSQRQKDQEEQNRFIEARKKSIQVEKERAAKVANFPSLPPNPIENIESRKLHAVKKSDVDAFSVTHYHMPETAVDREVDTAQPNAQEVALEEMQRLQELGQEEQKERREQLEKARLRGNHALRREQLTQDRERLLVELEHMHQTDLLRRRQVMAQMPAQIFQPLHKRQEMREDWQRDMEFAFEDMYTGERRVKGDLVLQLVPEPLPAVSTGSQDEDLDLTQEATPDLTPLAGAEEQQDEEPSRPLGGAPRQALKKLLTRIRSQRDQWSYRRLVDPPGDCRTTPTAECDTSAGVTTIETGSLASEERGRPLTTIPRLPDPSQSAQEESIVAGTLLHPDKQAIKIHTFETERKRREEELERQKQEQIALLQELEEKKSRLELLLQEAQQEREQLQTAMNQDTAAASGTQKIPAQDVTSVSPAAPTPESTITSAAEDDHSRRIREYQQRLLDQNRLHKQSVEEARRRLEEYQRTLRNRYSGVTTATCLPPGTTARLLPHFKGGINPPAVPLELPSGSVLLPCLPVSLSPHSRAHTPLDLPTQEPSILAQTLFLPGTAVGSHINSRTSPVQLEPTSESLRDQRAGVWLADNVFSRVTEDVPEKLPPPSTSLDPQAYRPHPVSLHPTPHIPLPSRTDPIPPISPTLSEESATLPGEAPVNPGSLLRAPAKFGEEVERQRQELREAQWRVEAQREVLFMQQRELEEQQREQRRRQREVLQALLTADDTQPGPETADGLGSEVLGSERLHLMAALLRAIEESNGQTSTSVESSQSQDDTLDVQSSHSDRPAPHPLPHPRAAKPPVARARLAIMEMTEQHELSAIQEVETPANASLITEESVAVSIERAIPEEQDHSANSERGHSSTSVSSAWEHTAGTGSETLTGSGRPSKLSWRERLRLEAGAFPGPDPISALPERSYHSCEFGRGVLGKSPTELESLSFQSARRPSEPDYLSSTTISSGSYVTTDPEHTSTDPEHTSTDPEHTSTDPEHTSTQIDSSLLLAGFGMGGGGKNKTSSVNGSSSCRHSSCRGVSGTGSPNLDSLIHSSSIQRIIDKYTRELNFSLSTAGNQMGPSAVIEGSVCEEPSSSVSQQKRQQKPWSKLLQENEGPDRSPVWGADPHTLPSDRESGAQRHDQEWDNTVNRIMDRLSDKSSSLVLDQGRDSTISPMTGQPSDKSSSPGQGWDSTLSRMIGQLSGQSTSLDQGWDSTLSRMIGRLSNQSTSVSQRLDQSSQWLDEVQDESRVMRPLVGELDESAAQWSGSSGWVDLRDSGQTGASSDPEGAPESQLLSSSSLPGREPPPHPRYQSLQHSGASSQEADRTGVDPASDSFHPLLAEVTHNETAEPSMTFHLPEEEVEGLCSHDEDDDHEAPAGDLELSACSEEFEDDTDPSVTSEPSPEGLRGGEEPPQPSPALHDSLYQLTTSQCLPHDSALQVFPGAEVVGLAACEDVSTLDMPLEGGDTDMESTPAPQRLDQRGAIKIEDLGAGKPDDQLCSRSKISPPIWERIMEVGSVKGIMDESMLTLVSLTDTTLQGQELTEEEEEMEESKSTMLPEEDASLQEEETTHSRAVMLLEFQSCPSVNLQEAFQQKRRALIQRSARRVEEIQAKRDEARANTITRAQSDISERRANTTTRAQSDISERRANTTTRTQSDPTTDQSTTSKPRREGRSAESTHAGGYAKQPKPQTPLQSPMLVSEAKLKKVGEVRISTPDIRKQDVAEMRKRTERLYSRLDEVKLQKEVRSRQEAYAKNREKAKDFHKKTLQKLRAKQSSQ